MIEGKRLTPRWTRSEFAYAVVVGLAVLTAALVAAGPAAALTPVEAGVMAPVNRFFDALTRRDPAGMSAEVAPGLVFMNERSGVLHPHSVEAIEQDVVHYPPGRLVEATYDPVVHVDGDLAVVWTPYTVTLDGKVQNCGTDAFSLVNDRGRWIIVGIADNARRNCR